MEKYINDLKNIKKEKDYLICVDSDGCTIDTMEIKHKMCFGPQMVEILQLHEISDYILETWNYVNLYSKTRGINRFKGFVKTLDLLRVDMRIKKLNVKIPEFKSVEKWIKKTKSLSMPELLKEIKVNNDEELIKLYNWSKKVNESIDNLGNVSKLFDNVLSAFNKMSKYADIIVVSSANHNALVKEWTHLGLSKYVKFIGGQEYGTKSNFIYNVMVGKYDLNKVIMIGDAPGDLKAAKDNKISFYPIIPKQEGKSWKIFEKEILEMFIKNKYKGTKEEEIIESYNKLLQ